MRVSNFTWALFTAILSNSIWSKSYLSLWISTRKIKNCERKSEPLSLHIIGMATLKKNAENNEGWQGYAKWETSCTVGNINWCSCYGKLGWLLKKLKTELAHDLVNSTSGYTLKKETNAWIQKDFCTYVISALLAIAKRRKQPRSAWTDGWMDKQIVVHTYNGPFPALKEWKFWRATTFWHGWPSRTLCYMK